MSPSTPPETPPTASPDPAVDRAQVALDPDALERLVERILDALRLSASPSEVHDAVASALASPSPEDALGAETGRDTPAPPAWLAVLHRALVARGVHARRVITTVPEALGTIGVDRPLVVAARDARGPALWLLSDRRADGVRADGPWLEAPRTLRDAALAAHVGGEGGASVEWLAVEPALPLSAGVAAPDEGAPHAHPTPEARLRAWMLAERHDLGVVLVYALFLGLFTLTLPVAAQALVGTVAFGTLLQPLVVLTALLLGALVMAGTLRGAQVYVVEVLQRRIFVRVVADLARRLPRVARDGHDGADPAALVNRFFDTFTVQKAAASLLLGGIEITLTTIVGLAVLAFYHPLLLAFDVALIVFVALIVGVLGRGGARTAIAESAAKYEVAAWLDELARGEAVFKSEGGPRYAERRAEALARGYLAERRRHFAVVFRQTLAVLALQAIANAAVLGLGGWLVIGRQLTLGQLVAAELIVTAVVSSLSKLGKYLESYYDLVAALDKLGYLADLPTEPASGAPLPVTPPDARGAQLVVASGRGDDLRVEPGAMVAVAPTPRVEVARLVDALAGHAPTGAIRVTIDGVDVRRADRDALRARVAVVRGGTISGSILDNVRLGRAGLDERTVSAALEAAGLLDEVTSLPDELRTKLARAGLHADAAWRLSVSRALAGNPSLIVLDEGLDALGPEARDAVLKGLAARRGCTRLVVSRDPAVHARCSAVIDLHAAEAGSRTGVASHGRA